MIFSKKLEKSAKNTLVVTGWLLDFPTGTRPSNEKTQKKYAHQHLHDLHVDFPLSIEQFHHHIDQIVCDQTACTRVG